MKQFIIITFSVVAIVLLPQYFIQAYVDNKVQTCYDVAPYYMINGVTKSHYFDADIVVFGNSRAACHYHSEIIDSILNVNCVNLGMGGRPFDMVYTMLIQPYLLYNEKPKLIIIEICPQAFFAHWNQIYQDVFLPYISKKEFDYYIEICEELNPLSRYLPVKYRGMSLNDFEKLFDSINTEQLKYKDGFTPCRVGEYHVNFVDTIYSIENDHRCYKYFTQFLQECESNHIPILLVCSPMHKNDFYDHCEMDRFWYLIDSLAPNLSKLDYSLMFGSDTTYFFESTHMNITGSNLFSTKLAQDIDSIGFIIYK